jgi:hypothetical protein
LRYSVKIFLAYSDCCRMFAMSNNNN